MAKVVNVIDLGNGDYEVVSTKNNIIYEIGKILGKEDINNLLCNNFEVNVKGPKEVKESAPKA